MRVATTYERGLVSPELQLVADLCRRAFVRAGCSKLRVPAHMDWDRVQRLAHFHRVKGLVSQSLSSLTASPPSGVKEAFAVEGRAIAVTNLRAAAECRDIRLDFDAAGVPLLFLKGLTLGALAYSKPLLKMGWDIDVLVAPGQVSTAGDILQRRGYRLSIPESLGKLENWHRQRKESLWAHDNGLFVELHSRLADNASLIPSIDIRSPSRTVDVADGIRLPTLEDDYLFAYLCVHGASSAWFRLKWITDLVGFIHDLPASEIERLYGRSQELGAYRAADQALLLADAIYGSLEGTSLRSRLAGDRGSQRLFRAAMRQIIDAREPTGRRLGTWRIHWTQLLLKRGMTFKVSEAFRQVRDFIA